MALPNDQKFCAIVLNRPLVNLSYPPKRHPTSRNPLLRGRRRGEAEPTTDTNAGRADTPKGTTSKQAGYRRAGRYVVAAIER